MGTNYYAIPVVNDHVKTQIKIAIDKNEYEQAKYLMPSKIHIGKSSIGWQFLFNHNNGDHYAQTRASIDVFLDRCTIFDEYNRPISKEDFWLMVESKMERQAETTYGFISDGLCFSKYTEFS